MVSIRPSTAALFQMVPVVPLPSSSMSVLYQVRSSGAAMNVPSCGSVLDAQPDQLLHPRRALQRGGNRRQVADEEPFDGVDLVLAQAERDEVGIGPRLELRAEVAAILR